MTVRISYWREMERWVAGGPDASAVAYPQVPLSELLTGRKESVASDQFAGCTPITIHFDGSVDRRDRTDPFKGAMFAAYPGDVVYSKIDVRNGALTIIPDELSRVVVTSEYPVYIPDHEQVVSGYLALVLRSQNFLHLLKHAATGTSGRKRVDSENFSALEVPLPEMPEQKSLLQAYENATNSGKLLREKAAALEAQAIRRFEEALGLTPPKGLPHRLFQIARFSEVERWSHEGILDRRLLAEAGKQEDRFSLVALGDVIEDLKNGWSPQCLDRRASDDEWGVLKLGAVSFGDYDESENKALPPTLQPQPDIEVKVGDVLISRANVLRLVGACAIVRESRHKLMLCDKIFRVIFQEPSPILPEFLAEVMKLPSVRQQIEAAATGTSPTMKNISKPSILELTFPLPQGSDGIAVQEKLVKSLRTARDEASKLRREAELLTATATSDFVNAIFH